MKAFLCGTAAAIIIAVGAHFALQSTGGDSASTYSTENVRLPEE